MALPQTMKTLYRPDPDSPSVELRTAVPLPAMTRPTDHVVRVHSLAFTNGELSWSTSTPGKEMIPGTDVAGVVVASASPTTSPFPVGARVHALMDFYRNGSGAEYVVVDQPLMARLPDNVSFDEGAAVPMGGLTAWQNLFVHGGLDARALFGDRDGHQEAREGNSRKKVLVVGAGGGVGTYVVQLAALAGCGSVVGVASGAKESLVRSLGATEFVDYTKTTVAEWVAAAAAAGAESREADIVLDLVGGKDRRAELWTAVRDGGGMLLNIVGDDMAPAPPEGLGKKDVKGMFTVVERDGTQLAEVGRLVAEKKLKVVFDKVYPFEEWQAAIDRAMGWKATGRVVVKLVKEE